MVIDEIQANGLVHDKPHKNLSHASWHSTYKDVIIENRNYNNNRNTDESSKTATKADSRLNDRTPTLPSKMNYNEDTIQDKQNKSDIDCIRSNTSFCSTRNGVANCTHTDLAVVTHSLPSSVSELNFKSSLEYK